MTVLSNHTQTCSTWATNLVGINQSYQQLLYSVGLIELQR